MSGRTALVTGVSAGIGQAIADTLIADGWAVVGLSRTAPQPQPGLYWFFCDVGDSVYTPGDILASAGIDRLDALVHCAGSQHPVGPVRESDPFAWAEAIRTNLIGTYAVVRHALPYLERSDDARVLLFSGGGAFNPRPNYSAYAAAKAGVVSFAETLAAELAGTRVAVNCVSPGFVPTGIHEVTLANRAAAGEQEWRQAVEGIARPTPMADVLACVRLLLSPDAAGLTGRSISVPHDDWRAISRLTVATLAASRMGTRDRHKVARLAALAATTIATQREDVLV